MLDFRINTFLTLCDTMNYRITAEKLNMTQPAVTQHIHFLENEYGCKLFVYNGKMLFKTESAKIIERHLRTMKYNENALKLKLCEKPNNHIKIGATKTIGGFVLNDAMSKFLSNKENTVDFTVDNTKNLLEMLDNGELDFAVIEGYFDRSKYDFRIMQKERFVGICSKDHRFSGKTIEIDEIFNETVIIREKGSGTRELFEQILHRFNSCENDFSRTLHISNFLMIKSLVKNNIGISFVYESIAKSGDVSVFHINGADITRDFTYVYLKNAIGVNEKINSFTK